ncbi:MAG: FHA domain-containing protein [Myxococcales bacterium]|nr:FHA domain-containing protein [Myxococcales bacterium]
MRPETCVDPRARGERAPSLEAAPPRSTPTGCITELGTGATRLLEPELLVGRSPRCALRLGVAFVSAEHALVRWTGRCWELRDLFSRNGTFLDGVRLRPGQDYALRRGSRIAFGKALEHQWELVDPSPPCVMAVPLDGAEPVLVEGPFLVLPSHDQPRVTIYRGREGGWLVEYPDESTSPVTNQQIIEVEGRFWRFCAPAGPGLLETADLELEVEHLELSFSVSRRDGRVGLHVACGGRAFDLGAREEHALLLALARRRLADAAGAIPEPASGWTYGEDLADPDGAAAARLDRDVFRVRKQFAELGVSDAVGIVQRRPRTRQYRIGSAMLSIVQL